jgi:hypothetical protein
MLILLFVISGRDLGGRGRGSNKFKYLVWYIWRHYVGCLDTTSIWVIKCYYFIRGLPTVDEGNGQDSSVQCNNAAYEGFSNVVAI